MTETASHNLSNHRPWPVPAGAPLMTQRWCDLLFIHWPVASASLRPLVHPALRIEEHGGSAWVAVTPFRIENMHAGFIPLPPFTMPELNVRTYVTDGNHAGVWFFSLDADSRLAVMGASLAYRLPYVYAEMEVHRKDSVVRYRSARPEGTAFHGEARVASRPRLAADDPFLGWYAERYCLYTGKSDGPLYTADIDHSPWQLSDAEVVVERNDMLAVHGITPAGEPAPPKLAEPLDVRIWPLRKATRRDS